MPGGINLVKVLKGEGFTPLVGGSSTSRLCTPRYIGYGPGKLSIGIVTGSESEELPRLGSLLDDLFGEGGWSLRDEGTGPTGPFTRFVLKWDTKFLNDRYRSY